MIFFVTKVPPVCSSITIIIIYTIISYKSYYFEQWIFKRHSKEYFNNINIIIIINYLCDLLLLKVISQPINSFSQVSHDHRSCEGNLSNCVEKPEKVRTSTGFEPVTSWYRRNALSNWAMKPLTLGARHLWVLMSPWRMDVKWCMKCFIYWTVDLSNVSGFIAQLDRASHWYREVTGSDPVEVLTFSGFCSQLLKLRSQLRWSWLTWYHLLFGSS